MIFVRRLLPVALVPAVLSALLAAVLSVGLSAPAGATVGSAARPGDCAPLDGSDKAALLDAARGKDVFVGRVIKIGDASATGSITYEVAVKDVLRGTVASGTRVQVTINWMSTSPSQSVTKTNYLFLVTQTDQGLDADRCRGTVEIRDKGANQRIAKWQKWIASAPEVPPTDPADPTDSPAVHFSEPDEPLGEPQGLSRVVAPGAALALVGLLGLLLVTRLGRRR